MAPMAPGVSAEKMHLRMPFPGRQMSAIADAPGPHILLEAGGLLLNPAELLRRLRRQQGLCPSHEKLGGGVGEHCGDGSAKRTARRAWEWRVGGCGRAQGQGLGGRNARSPAALPTWPLMVAKCSGAMALHLLAIRGAPGSPRAEIWQRWEQMAPSPHAKISRCARHDTCASR